MTLYVGRWSSSREFKKFPLRGAQARQGCHGAVLGEMWANPWEALPWTLLKISLAWSTGETRVSWSSPGGDVSKSWGSAPLNASKNLPRVEHRRDKGVTEQSLGRCEQILGNAPLNPSKNLPHVEHRRDKGVMEQAWGRCEQILGKRSPDPFCAPRYFVLRAPRYSALRTSHLMLTLCLWLKPTLGGITQTVYF